MPQHLQTLQYMHPARPQTHSQTPQLLSNSSFMAAHASTIPMPKLTQEKAGTYTQDTVKVTTARYPLGKAFVKLMRDVCVKQPFSFLSYPKTKGAAATVVI